MANKDLEEFGKKLDEVFEKYKQLPNWMNEDVKMDVVTEEILQIIASSDMSEEERLVCLRAVGNM